MPKVNINTYSSFEIMNDGTILRVPVTNIVSEEAVVPNISKEVSVFDKYTSKKNISAKAKTANADMEMAR